LIKVHPQAISQINKLGETPLKTAQRNSNCRHEVIQYLEKFHKQHQMNQKSKE